MPLFKLSDLIKKKAGEEQEPTPETHASAPAQKLRPRAEVVIYNATGIIGIKKDGYLLMPGGGIPDGERPSDAATREALEEADRICHNLEPRDKVSTVYNKSVMSYKDWDGETTNFFIALDGGEAGMNHKDREPFKVITYAEAMMYLNDLLNDKKQEWAFANNMARLNIIKEARRKVLSGGAGLTPIKYAHERGDPKMNELYEYVKQASIEYGYLVEMEKDATTPLLTPEEQARANELYTKNLHVISKAPVGALPAAAELPAAAPSAAKDVAAKADDYVSDVVNSGPVKSNMGAYEKLLKAVKAHPKSFIGAGVGAGALAGAGLHAALSKKD